MGTRFFVTRAGAPRGRQMMSEKAEKQKHKRKRTRVFEQNSSKHDQLLIEFRWNCVQHCIKFANWEIYISQRISVCLHTFKDYLKSKLILFDRLLRNKGNIIFENGIPQQKELQEAAK